MPELPEVESIRRTLSKVVIGRRVRSVRAIRKDVIHGPSNTAALLRGRIIERIDRHGKQLAVLTDLNGNPSPCVCIHLGMSGSLRYQTQIAYQNRALTQHIHVVWYLDSGEKIVFRDPRRFGGIWTFVDRDELWATRWKKLGPDALRITAVQLHRHLSRTTRVLKAALLDQSVLAGLGNIYVDELLFTANLHPLTPSYLLSLDLIRTLVRRMRQLLKKSISDGGSTFRDYVNANGTRGRFQQMHHVYGRGSQPCWVCNTRLMVVIVSGRTTVYCATCQSMIDRTSENPS